MHSQDDYQQEVKALFERFELGEMTFSEMRKEVERVVKELEEDLWLQVEKNAGEDW